MNVELRNRKPNQDSFFGAGDNEGMINLDEGRTVEQHSPTPLHQYSNDKERRKKGCSLWFFFIILIFLVTTSLLGFVGFEVYEKYKELNDIHSKTTEKTKTTFMHSEQKLDHIISLLERLEENFQNIQKSQHNHHKELQDVKKIQTDLLDGLASQDVFHGNYRPNSIRDPFNVPSRKKPNSPLLDIFEDQIPKPSKKGRPYQFETHPFDDPSDAMLHEFLQKKPKPSSPPPSPPRMHPSARYHAPPLENYPYDLPHQKRHPRYGAPEKDKFDPLYNDRRAPVDQFYDPVGKKMKNNIPDRVMRTKNVPELEGDILDIFDNLMSGKDSHKHDKFANELKEIMSKLNPKNNGRSSTPQNPLHNLESQENKKHEKIPREDVYDQNNHQDMPSPVEPGTRYKNFGNQRMNTKKMNEEQEEELHKILKEAEMIKRESILKKKQKRGETSQEQVKSERNLPKEDKDSPDHEDNQRRPQSDQIHHSQQEKEQKREQEGELEAKAQQKEQDKTHQEKQKQNEVRDSGDQLREKDSGNDIQKAPQKKEEQRESSEKNQKQELESHSVDEFNELRELLGLKGDEPKVPNTQDYKKSSEPKEDTPQAERKAKPAQNREHDKEKEENDKEKEEHEDIMEQLRLMLGGDKRETIPERRAKTKNLDKQHDSPQRKNKEDSKKDAMQELQELFGANRVGKKGGNNEFMENLMKELADHMKEEEPPKKQKEKVNVEIKEKKV